MTFTPLRIKALSSDETQVLNTLLKQLHDKLPRNVLRASYYDGKRAIRQVGSIIPPQYYKLGLVLGWSAQAVDIPARRAKLEGFIWPDGDLDSLGTAEVQDDNMLLSEIAMGVTSALIHGVSFLVTTAGDEGEPDALVHSRDAASSTGLWNRRTHRLDAFLSVLGWDHDRPNDFILYLPTQTIAVAKRGGKWEVTRTPVASLNVEPLIFKQRSGRDFGSSRISRPLMSIHDQALREIIRLEGHMDIFSFPELWMLGADGSVFRNEDGSLKPDWQIMLGRIKGLPDDEGATNPRADVKQFPAASPQPHLATLNAFAKMFAREASLPDTALAITDVSNPTSAEAYDASQFELIALAEDIIDDFTPAITRTMHNALAIKNGLSEVPAEWKSIQPRWRDPRYLSRSAVADAGVKQVSQAPWLAETEVGLELLGLDPQQIDRALADRRRMAGRGVLDALRTRAEQLSVPPVPAPEEEEADS